ncbi:MAG: DUF2513 domain-containing protein [Thermoguttaceae bacterium]|jgi:hypothetical protein
MKRDMELIKFLLGKLEAAEPETAYIPTSADIPGENPPSEPEINEHCRLIVERGLACGQPSLSGWVLTGLTWEGHDFLDNSRESKVWQAAKKAAGHLSFGVFTKVLVETATRYAMSKIETI